MARQLPQNPSIEHLRKEAKSLLKAQKRADSSCCDTLRILHNLRDKTDAEVLRTPVALSEVQFALANDYGFSSWPALVGKIEGRDPAAKGTNELAIDHYLRAYLDGHMEEFRGLVVRATNAHDIKWMPGMKSEERWQGMEFMREGGKMLAQWHSSWPPGIHPPGWDVMCRVRRGANSWERVYIWCISNISHLRGNADADSQLDLDLIEEFCHQGKKGFGVAEQADWDHGYYPHAIRLSVLGFLRANKSCGRLLFVYCADSEGGQKTALPGSGDWEKAIAEMNVHLGLDGTSVLERRVHTAFLEPLL